MQQRKHTASHYWKNHGFTCDPFTLGNIGHAFVSPEWEEYLDLLPQFVRFCNTLLLVTGEPNVGKSTLMSEFTREKLTETDVIYINAKECSGIEYLLQLLHERYSAPLNNEATIPASVQLDEQLAYLKENHQRRLLIIDDAEQLPLDMRQACLQIIQQQTPMSTCLPIILVGTTTLNLQFNALLTPTTAKECLHIMYVQPLDQTQTEAYLKWCCLQAGGDRQHFPFSDADVETIYINSRGAIGAINSAATERLTQQPSQTSFHWRQLLQGKFLWWGVTIIVIIILLYLYQIINRPPELSKTFTKPLTMREPQTSTPKTAKDFQVSNAIVKSNPQPAPSEQAQSAEQPATTPAIVKPQTRHSSPAQPLQPAPTQAKATTQPTNIIKKMVTHKAAPAKVSPLFTSVMSQRMKLQKQRLLKVNPKSYTLQLVAGQNLPAIQKFILTHRIQETALIAKVKRQGKTWYIVVYGAFPSAEAAKQGTKLLSADLQAQKPWPRSYKSIQEMLKSADEK